jgi:hypothetical protein
MTQYSSSESSLSLKNTRYLHDYICRGFRSRLDEEVDNARPNDPVMLGAQFELDLSTDLSHYSSLDPNDPAANVYHGGNTQRLTSHVPVTSLGSGSDDQNSDSNIVISNEQAVTTELDTEIENEQGMGIDKQLNSSRSINSSGQKAGSRSDRSGHGSTTSDDSIDSYEVFTPSFDTSPWVIFCRGIFISIFNWCLFRV